LSLLHRLLVLVLLAVLPAVGVGAYHEFELRQIRERQVHDEALRLARLADSEIGRIAEATHELLTAFAENPFVGNGNWGECNTAAVHLMSHFDAYFNIGVVNTEGEIVCSGRPRSRGLNVRSSDAFNQAVAADDFLIGTYTTSVLDGSKILPFTEVVFDTGGKKIGFIFAALQLDWLKQQFVSRFADPNVSLLVVDRNSTILLRIPDPERWVGSQLDAKYSELLHATADGTAEITGVDGVRRIIGYSPLAIDPVGIYVGVGLTKAEVFAAIDGATLKGSVLVALCLCLALVAAWFGGIAFLRRPIDALLQAAESWRRGDYSARTAMTDPRSELARLGRAFDDMAAELERREGKIRQANELLEQRVAERTTKLLEANQRLATETGGAPKRCCTMRKSWSQSGN
jgi:HAMP domain-containing protein